VGDVTGADRLLVVVGMPREAAIARGSERGPDTLVGTDRLGTILAERAACVLSFGLCGALDPALKVGDLIIGSGVAAPGGFQPCDVAWLESLKRAFPAAMLGSIPATPDIFADPAARAELRAQSGGVAVDIESGRIAAEAIRTNVPFAILRCVSDDAYRTLPRSAVAGFADNGQIRPIRVLAELVRRPWELGALIRTAVEAAIAFRALGDARDLLGPGLGCPYLGQHLIDVAGEHEVR